MSNSSKAARSAHRYALILAGGRGTRFWPRSRRANAKQVLRFFGEQSLIQQTVQRLAPMIPPERIWVLTNDHLRAEIVKQLAGVPKNQILAEPAARNTAPAIGLAAHILQGIDPDAVMGVFPSDHVIGRPKQYLALVEKAFRAAETGGIGLLGIEPRWAETGYGYVEFPKGVKAGETARVKRFREKPDAKTAKKYVAAGNFYWNAGMFFWKTSLVLDSLRKHLPKTAALLASLPKFGGREFGARLAEAFPHCENISIDYAVLEPASKVKGAVVGVTAGDIGWNDVGSWNAVYELLDRDQAGNAARGELVAHESKGNYVDAEGKLIALVGVDDLVVVDTPDALLITRRECAQKVGDLVKLLEKQKRDHLL